MENSIDSRLEEISKYTEENISEYDKYLMLRNEKDFFTVNTFIENIENIKYSKELNVFAVEKDNKIIFMDFNQDRIITLDNNSKLIDKKTINDFINENIENKNDYSNIKNFLDNEFIRDENELLEKVSELIENRSIPWMNEQEAGISYLPYNMENGNEYHGMNLIKLMVENYKDPRFLTHNQADKLGLVLKDTELPTTVKYYKDEDILKQILSEPQLMEYIAIKKEQPTVKNHYIYNASQFENTPELDHSKLNLPSEKVEEVIKSSGINISHVSNAETLYTAGNNTITIKPKDEFNNINEYYREVMGSIVGAKLDEEISNGNYLIDKHSSKAYLINELSTFIINSELQIGHTPNKNNLANMQEWSKNIRNDQNYLKDVAKESDKIVMSILGDKRKELIQDRQDLYNEMMNSQEIDFEKKINESNYIKVSPYITFSDSNKELNKVGKDYLDSVLKQELDQINELLKYDIDYFKEEFGKKEVEQIQNTLNHYIKELNNDYSVKIATDINEFNEKKHIMIFENKDTAIVLEKNASLQPSQNPNNIIFKNKNNNEIFALDDSSNSRLLDKYLSEKVDINHDIKDKFNKIIDLIYPNPDEREVYKYIVDKYEKEELLLNQLGKLEQEKTKDLSLDNSDLGKQVINFVKEACFENNEQQNNKKVILSNLKENMSVDFTNNQFVLKNEDIKITLKKNVILLEDLKTNEKFGQEFRPNALPDKLRNQFKEIMSEKENLLNKPNHQEKIYFAGDYKYRKEIAKKGGMWDKNAKSWYINSDSGLKIEDFHKFSKNNQFESKELANSNLENNKKENKYFLAVPFSDKDEAKKLGAKWDNENKSWFCNETEKEVFKKWDPDKHVLMSYNFENSEQKFLSRLQELGVTEYNLIGDGQKHRIQVEGDKGKEKSGFYVYHSDGVPNIYFKNHRTGIEEKIVDKGIERTPEEKEFYHERVKAKKLQKEQELTAKKEKAANLLKYIYSKSDNIENHEYLDKKNIKASNDIKITQQGDMMIPIYDIDGNLKSAQYIKNDGSKIFAKDCELSNTIHIIDKELDKLKKNDVVIVSEGYATAKTIHEAMRENGERDIPVVAAMSAGSIENAIATIRKKFPEKKIIIGADNDLNKSINTGLEAAEKAAKKFKDVHFITPKKEGVQFNGDFNDLVSKNNDRPKEKVLKEICDNVKSKVKEITKDKVVINEIKNEKSQTIKKEQKNVVTKTKGINLER